MDAIQVIAEDHLLRGFRRSFEGLGAGTPFAEVAPAGLALPLTGLQLQVTVPQPPVLMPHSPLIAAFVAQPVAPAVRTQSRPDEPGRNPDPAVPELQTGNLIVGQS